MNDYAGQNAPPFECNLVYLLVYINKSDADRANRTTDVFYIK